ncbi:MAG: GNAT family N-acetyltransferase [Clostridia bacterium]
MITRFITQDEYLDAKRIWGICFPGDAGAFCDYYFKYRTNPQRIIAAFEGVDMLGTLHIIPQTLEFFGIPKPIGFVAGVATLPQYRKMGIAAAMLKHSFAAMREAGHCATVLQPFDVGFYEKFGYAPFVYRREYSIDKAVLKGSCVLHEPGAAELLSMYCAFKARYNGMMLRKESDMETLLAEREGGARFVATDTAYAMYYEDSCIDVMELAGENLQPLLAQLNSRAALKVRLPADVKLGMDGELAPFNMLKVLNETELLRALPCNVDGLLHAASDANYSFESY